MNTAGGTMNSVNSTDVAVIVWDGWDVLMLGIMCIIIVIACHDVMTRV